MSDMSSQRKDLGDIIEHIMQDKELSYVYSQISKDIRSTEIQIKTIQNGIFEHEQDLEYVMAYIESNVHASKYLRVHQPIIPMAEYRRILNDIASAEKHLKMMQGSLKSLNKLLKEKTQDLEKSRKIMEKFINSIQINKVLSYENYVQKRRSR